MDRRFVSFSFFFFSSTRKSRWIIIEAQTFLCSCFQRRRSLYISYLWAQRPVAMIKKLWSDRRFLSTYTRLERKMIHLNASVRFRNKVPIWKYFDHFFWSLKNRCYCVVLPFCTGRKFRVYLYFCNGYIKRNTSRLLYIRTTADS